MIFLSVDPSINHVGFATLQMPEADWNWGVYETDPSANLLYRVKETADFLLARIPPSETLVQLIIEYPSFRGDTKGKIAAMQGYTLDLAMICGYLASAVNLPMCQVFFYTPQQWKGQKNKHMVECAFLRTFGDQYKGTSDHAFEAAMMLYKHCQKNDLL